MTDIYKPYHRAMEPVTGRKILKFRVGITEKLIPEPQVKTITLSPGTGNRM